MRGFRFNCCRRFLIIYEGFGVKIVGGQYLPWSGDQLCAYVAYIFPGSVADQIHGELQEGKIIR